MQPVETQSAAASPSSPSPDEAVLELTPKAVATAKASDKSAGEMTPFMRQWSAAKRENPDALLFFRMGDFYELFYDDAVVASRELQLTLTARDRERQVPMCGVPYHSVETYLTRLLRRGFRIAICEQMEDPKLAKKIVRREVTRVLSPGTALDAALGQEANNFLAAYFEAGSAKESVCAVALLDVSTGEFRTAEFEGPKARQEAVEELLLASPSEVLLPASAEIPAGLDPHLALVTVIGPIYLRLFFTGEPLDRPVVEQVVDLVLDGVRAHRHPEDVD